jgi:Mg-chelatase subunit ChlD
VQYQRNLLTGEKMNNNILFEANQRVRLLLRHARYYREEIFVSPADAASLNINNRGQFVIFAVGSEVLGAPEERYPLWMRVSEEVTPGTLQLNQIFIEQSKLERLLGNGTEIWTVERSPKETTIKEAVIEISTEQRDVKEVIEDLQREHQQLFVNRGILIEDGSSRHNLKLTKSGYTTYKLRSLEAATQAPRAEKEETLFTFGRDTRLKLFVPGRKSGADMVIVVDVSGSMMVWADYVDESGIARFRLRGVRNALKTLFQQRLRSGSLISRVALVVFGTRPAMWYPWAANMVELTNEASLQEIQQSINSLTEANIKQRGLDISHTDISAALNYAAEVMNQYSIEGNEKILLLLSDGADWTEDESNGSMGEVVKTVQDPVVLAERLFEDSQIRVHTVAISNESNYQRYIVPKYGYQKFAVPNVQLLTRIADATGGVFFPSADAIMLAERFQEIGQGALYPL